MSDWSATSPRELLRGFLSCGNENTEQARAIDLRRFAEFLGVKKTVSAVKNFLDLPRGPAKRKLDEFAAEQRRKYSLATIRRRLATSLRHA